MTKTTLMTGICCAVSACVSAAGFTLAEGVSGVFDWTNGVSYVGGTAPQKGAGDSVTVPAGVEVVISNGMDAASLELIGSLARIVPNDGSRIVFHVGAGQTLELGCAVNSGGSNGATHNGELVKRGDGVLFLNAAADAFIYSKYCQAYYLDLTVEGGELRFDPSWHFDTARHTAVRYGKVTVAEGAVWCPFTSGKANIVGGLCGGGTITNAATAAHIFYISGGTAESPNVFSGKMLGYPSLGNSGAAYQHFTGTNSTCYTTFDTEGNMAVNGGCIGIRRFGLKGGASSIGAQNSGSIASRNGAYLKSLRLADDPPDVCDKIFTLFTGDGAGVFTIDGGAVGGVEFSGTWNEHSTKPGQKRIVLTGDNVEPCIFSGILKRGSNDGYPTHGYSYYITKRGMGTWRRLNNSSDKLSGVIAVENGTLEYDTLRAKGTTCALGSALDLYRDVDANGKALTTDDEVDYALLLGDGTATAEGNLRYIGTAAVSCTDRPLALKGRGRLTNASARDFTFADVFTVGTSANTLTLDGDDTTAENVLSGVNDAKRANGGALSIVKEGAGTWHLRGDISIRGDIAVKAGTLVVGKSYSWYKWVMKSTYYEHSYDPASARTYIQLVIGDVGLYAADGTRQNAAMTYTRLGYPNLQPGHIDYGFTATDGFQPQSNSNKNVWDLSLLTDGLATTDHFISFWYRTATDIAANGGVDRNVPHGDPTAETTWLPIVMRLADDAKPVSRFDYLTVNSANTAPYRTVLYASENGTDWDEVMAERTSVPGGKWQLADRAVDAAGDSVHTNALGEADGLAIAAFPAVYRTGYLANVASFSVAANATLKLNADVTIKGLTVDAAGAGTIVGGAFAETGTLSVTGLTDNLQAVTVPITLETTAGFANLAGWQYSEGGRPSQRFRIVVKEQEGAIVLVPRGFAVNIR